MSNHLISIIIPTFNRAQLIQETLDSVHMQTYPHWECIIVDDGSTDNTEEVIDHYLAGDSRLHYYHRPNDRPKGASSCRNYGAELSRGDYIIFLDDDDSLAPFCLANRIEEIKKDASLDFLVFPMKVRYPGGAETSKRIPEDRSPLISFLSYQIHWGIMAPIWRKEFFLKLGGFKTNYPRFNDPELQIRALLAQGVNYKVCYDSLPDSIYCMGQPGDAAALAKRYLESIFLFIPDIVGALEKANHQELKKYLKGYLELWMKHGYNAGADKETLLLLKLFHDHGIISPLQYSLLSLFVYQIIMLDYIGRGLKSVMVKLSR